MPLLWSLDGLMIRPYRHVAPNRVFNWVGACHYNTTGDENTAVGYQALFASNTDVWPVTLAKGGFTSAAAGKCDLLRVGKWLRLTRLPGLHSLSCGG
jgi:hypothetical protein